MNIVEIIEKKQASLELSKSEIEFVINGYTSGDIPAYQMSAFLMAVYFCGMTDSEATTMALVMRDSGEILKFDDVKGFKVDKHSTGGVGDKTTLVLGPMLAACGITFAKMSGRGLGHTGGTIDKLESIPGFKTTIPDETFKNNLNEIGLAIIGQTKNLAPADKKIYALRDVTATVASIPLIASSIMSKKLAIDTDAILLDVKVGNGAFMKNVADATKLADLMVQIGRDAGKCMTALLTDMETPLGCAVGNSLEVIEAIETLKGNGPKDLEELCCTIAAYLIMDSDNEIDYDSAFAAAKESIENGSAFEKFKQMVVAQGGDETSILDTTKLPLAKNVLQIRALREGYIEGINALMIGEAACNLGAGRKELGQEIDFGVGVIVNKKPGDHVECGEPIATIYYNEIGFEEAKELVYGAFTISDNKIDKKLILGIVR